MKPIEKLFIRIVGDNTPDAGESDLKLKELDSLNGLKWSQIQSLKRKLVKADIVEEVSGFLTLTESGKEYYRGEKDEIYTDGITDDVVKKDTQPTCEEGTEGTSGKATKQQSGKANRKEKPTVKIGHQHKAGIQEKPVKVKATNSLFG